MFEISSVIFLNEIFHWLIVIYRHRVYVDGSVFLKIITISEWRRELRANSIESYSVFDAIYDEWEGDLLAITFLRHLLSSTSLHKRK